MYSHNDLVSQHRVHSVSISTVFYQCGQINEQSLKCFTWLLMTLVELESIEKFAAAWLEVFIEFFAIPA